MTRRHTTPCPSCQGPRPAGVYVCRDCWYHLPAAARTALWRRDEQAAYRLRQLLDQLSTGTPLDHIRITP